MENLNTYKDVIYSFVKITNRVHDIKKQKVKKGDYINVFTLWNEFSDITKPIHSRILNFLLSEHPMHGQGNRFIDLFLQRIGISPSPSAEWLATAEIGRVDVMLKRFSPKSLMVSGYQESVDAMDSSIADIAIMNDLLSQEEIEVERYTDRDSKFYQKYESLLDNLDFHAC